MEAGILPHFRRPPGAHGAGVSALLASRNWDDLGDIADVYVRWGAHVYGEGEKGSVQAAAVYRADGKAGGYCKQY